MRGRENEAGESSWGEFFWVEGGEVYLTGVKHEVCRTASQAHKLQVILLALGKDHFHSTDSKITADNL